MVILEGYSSPFAAWIRHFLACMGGCFGCCAKPTPVTAVDEPSKGLRIQGRAVKKPDLSDDFWSSSTCDLEYSAVQSRRSVSSISISNQNTGSAGSIGSNTEFVNHGLISWHQERLQWIGDDTPMNQTKQRWQPRLSWNATYDSLLGSRNPFPRPIPLTEMVGFLVDLWDHEGLYN